MSLIWNDAITDRKSADVALVKELNYKWLMGTISENEKLIWEQDLKGALNTSDLIRIENNIQLLSDVLELNLTTYVGRVPELPRQAYFTNLVNNVARLRATGILHATTPKTPAKPLNLYTKWNAIEKILEDIYNILNSNFYHYCGGSYYCGDTIGLLL